MYRFRGETSLLDLFGIPQNSRIRDLQIDKSDVYLRKVLRYNESNH